MAINEFTQALAAKELEALFGGDDIEALHKLAGEEGKLVVREDGTIEVVAKMPGRESFNG